MLSVGKKGLKILTNILWAESRLIMYLAANTGQLLSKKKKNFKEFYQNRWKSRAKEKSGLEITPREQNRTLVNEHALPTAV